MSKLPASRILSQFKRPWLLAPDVLQDLREIALRARAPDFEAVLAARGDRTPGELVTMRGSVAILPVFGPIFPRANLFTEISGATSIDVLALEFRRALNNPKVSTVILNVDSPGGQVAGISEFAQMVRAAKKPTVAYVGGMAASAGYWIASAASRIVVADTAWLGSIGVVSMFSGDADGSLIEIVSAQSPLKRTDVRTEAGRAVKQKHVDDLAAVFIDHVAQNRRVTVDRVLKDFGKGDVLLGRSAVQAGMADAVGSLEGVIADHRGKPSGAQRATKESDDDGQPLALLDFVQAYGLDKGGELYAARLARR